MGLLDNLLGNVPCAICGKKKGLSGSKLSDGNCLCKECAAKVFSTHFPLGAHEKYSCSRTAAECTLEEYEELAQMREDNLQELEDFSPTVSCNDAVHIDTALGKIVFAYDSDINDPDELQKKNPIVYDVRDLLFTMTTNSDKEEETLTGKPKLVRTVSLTMVFANPLVPVVTVDLGEITAKSGFLGSVKTKTSAGLEEFMAELNSLQEDTIAYCIANDIDAPIVNQDLRFTTIKKYKRDLGLSRSDIDKYLRDIFPDDKHAVREIRKKYGL